MSSTHDDAAADDRPDDPSTDDRPDDTFAGNPELQDRIEQLLLGGPRKYTRKDVAELSGVPSEATRRRWRALGFAAAEDDAVLFADCDVEAARISNGLIESGIIDEAMDVAVVRTLGHHLSRLAEWQTNLVRELLVEQPDVAANDQQLVAMVEAVVPAIERLQSYVWRRHVAAFAGRAFGPQSGDVDAGNQAVGFVDMVGYTRLTRKVDETELASVLDRFEAVAAGVVADRQGRIVKMIGDEVMFVADTPTEAIEIALAMNERAEDDDEIPELRTGLAFGHVLSRLGDVYGRVVNIAARLTSTARPGTIVLDQQLAEALGDDPPYDLRSLRPVSVRGYSKLKRYAVKRS